MSEQIKTQKREKRRNRDQTGRKPLTVEALEARIAPTLLSDKKAPEPPPYPPGTRYGLIRRDKLQF
ncbi:MAG: hypothetical protein JXA30_04940 [Deltaproteobacteria bacterium]|nr:hypothetical protein [Deltaproteobacteria bacterium]